MSVKLRAGAMQQFPPDIITWFVSSFFSSLSFFKFRNNRFPSFDPVAMRTFEDFIVRFIHRGNGE